MRGDRMIYLFCVMGGAIFGASLMCLMMAASELDRMEERWGEKDEPDN